MRRLFLEPGGVYDKEEVIRLCTSRIPKVQNPREKQEYIDLIQQSPYDKLVWKPSAEAGWGASPMNPNNWRSVDGAALPPHAPISKKRPR